MRNWSGQGADDEDLVRSFRQDPEGDIGRAAASELFERYWQQVYLWCLRRLGQHETARDVAQDVLLSAYQALGTFEGRCLYRSWLFTIMRNRCFRELRRPGLVRDESVETDLLTGTERSVDSVLEDEEEEQEILDLIRQVLDPEEQAALWLRVREHVPVEEISRRLQISAASGARGVLQSARRKLRAALERRAAQQRGSPT